MKKIHKERSKKEGEIEREEKPKVNSLSRQDMQLNFLAMRLACWVKVFPWDFYTETGQTSYPKSERIGAFLFHSWMTFALIRQLILIGTTIYSKNVNGGGELHQTLLMELLSILFFQLYIGIWCKNKYTRDVHIFLANGILPQITTSKFF